MTTQEGTVDTDHQQFAPPEAWDAIAVGYDQFVAPGEEPFALDALRLVGLQAGERFLDVAAGSGGLSLPAARLGASVMATDWSPAMIEQFKKRVRAEGLVAVEGRVMDVHALAFDDDSFDVTGSQFGVMLVPDQIGALREMVRVTTPRGRVLVIAYGDPAQFEALQFFVAAIEAVVPGFAGLPDDPPPLEFQASDPAIMRARLSAAGLCDIRVDTQLYEMVEFRDGDECWNWMRNGNPVVGMILSEISDESQKMVREVLHGMIRERAGGATNAVLTAPLTIGWGWKQ
jgi:ubiquinone/menaquinone biosynthesis C-methylase UbiE